MTGLMVIALYWFIFLVVAIIKKSKAPLLVPGFFTVVGAIWSYGFYGDCNSPSVDWCTSDRDDFCIEYCPDGGYWEYLEYVTMSFQPLGFIILVVVLFLMFAGKSNKEEAAA